VNGLYEKVTASAIASSSHVSKSSLFQGNFKFGVSGVTSLRRDGATLTGVPHTDEQQARFGRSPKISFSVSPPQAADATRSARSHVSVNGARGELALDQAF
jgi:hypothetical protein